MNRVRVALAGVGVLAALLAGCGYDDTPLPEAPKAEPPATAPDPECTTVDADYASYEPSDDVVPGGKVEEIRDRGRLIVGVSADTYLMASANPEEGNKIEGFDIEFAKAIGRAIFEDTDAGFEAGRNIQFRVITAAKRIELLQSGDLDLVVRNFTINCSRWQDIAFSQVYYGATQKVLVSKSLADSGYGGIEDLSGLDVCAPIGSTSLDNVLDAADEAGVDPPELEPADNHTGCLIKFQRGEVDAITGDDTVLAGLAAQDPYAVVPQQDPLNPEPYGIGANQDDVDLVKFVNAVLEDMRGTGDGNSPWQAAYSRWLKPALSGVDAAQPPPTQPYRTE
jgi:polar amino acid transport system substrate-binding protein